MSTKSIPKDKKLWESIKEEIKNKYEKRWNAHYSQLLAKEYKKRGGQYTTKKPSEKNSLNQWTKEKWVWVDGVKNGRYLPKSVADSLTPRQRKITINNKIKGDKKGIQNVEWEDFVIKKMKKFGYASFV